MASSILRLVTRSSIIFSYSATLTTFRLTELIRFYPLVPIPRRPTWRGILDETLDENWVQTRSLPEDMSLLGFTPLTAIHSKLDKKWSRLTRDCHYLEVISPPLTHGYPNCLGDFLVHCKGKCPYCA